MFKFVASLCAALGLVAFAPMPAQAVPVSTCAANGTQDTIGNDLLTCNLFDDPTQEQVTVTDPFANGTPPFTGPDWFTPSYAILFDVGDGTDSDVVAFTRVQNPAGGSRDQVTLYSEGSASFGAALAAALSAPVNARTRVAEGAGGLATFFVNFQSGVGASSAFAGCNGAANCDTINVNSPEGAGPPPSAVPEPATLTLMGLAGAVAAIRRRRKATV
jgi:hypothetical protein